MAGDPTTVSCVITDPAGAATTHTYLGANPADIVKALTGKYTLSVPCSPSVAGVEGLWSYDWIGTGAVSDVQPGTWRVWGTDQYQWYVGPEELKDRLSVTDPSTDSQIIAACRSASRWIERYCGRHFYRISATRTYQPHNIWLLNTDDIVSVTQLAVDTTGNGVYDTTWTQGTQYALRVGDDDFNPASYGELRPYTQVQVIYGVSGGGAGGGQWFPFTWPFSHLDRVQIQGVFGWPQVPPLINQAALLIAADWFKLKDAPWGVAGISDLGLVKTSPNPWLIEELRPYIRGRRKVGV